MVLRDVVREHDARGAPIHDDRKINQAGAAVVHRIFAEFAAGRSLSEIARRLDAVQIAGSRSVGDRQRSTAAGNAAQGVLHKRALYRQAGLEPTELLTDPATGRQSNRLGRTRLTSGSCRTCRASGNPTRLQ
jgi:hypothetical protein